MKFQMIQRCRDLFPIRLMCRCLRVSPSGYYGWATRPASSRAQENRRLLARIRALHREHDGVVGSPRIWEDLRYAGEQCGRHRVARLMRRAGLQGVPQELMEAAEIDGAGAWQRFRSVVLPFVSPITFFNLVIGIIGSFQVFTAAFIMTDGEWITQVGLSQEPTLAADFSGRSFQVGVGDRIDAVEKRLILATVQHTHTKEAAAEILGISVKTLYNRLRAYESGADLAKTPPGDVQAPPGGATSSTERPPRTPAT